MTRINALRNIAGTRDSVAWGKFSNIAAATWGNVNALVFAAALIACSITVGCSSEQPKPVSSNIQIPSTQSQNASMPAPAPVLQADNKPAPKKVVHKKPATVNYTDKTYGVTFEYPRRYAIETGDAAAELVQSNPMPMNFVQPGGVALAAVELPETGFANTDFSSAFFNVSVHKTLTADQCIEFAVPQPKELQAAPVSTAPETVNQVAAAEESKPSTPTSTESAKTEGQSAKAESAPAEASSPASAPQASSQPASQPSAEPQGSKLLVGDLDLRATEAVSGEGTRQSDSKYFHVFQSGACYEFALNVTTVASQDGLIKHVDRDKVFNRLEKILATVKINPVAAPEVTAETPATPTAPMTPAQ
jgi:hypothetical protein